MLRVRHVLLGIRHAADWQSASARAWIAERLRNLNELLAARAEKSALALRRLTGSVTRKPEKPELR